MWILPVQGTEGLRTGRAAYQLPCPGEPRSEPDSGNPTVRDRRGASGNVAMGVGLRPRTKGLDEPPDPTAHASEIYPDCLNSSTPHGKRISAVCLPFPAGTDSGHFRCGEELF